MNNIGREYAQAAFELAAENNLYTEYLNALKLVDDNFIAQPQYVQLLSSPNIPVTVRQSLISDAFDESVPEHILNLLKIMCKKGHIRFFSNTVAEYEEMYNSIKLIKKVRVVSAVQLSNEQKLRLCEKLEKKCGGKVEINYELDASILGGMIIYTDGKIYDASLARKLKDIKEVMGK